MTLDELWPIARQYGKVFLFTQDDGTYSCDINFITIKNTNLSAKSGYGIKTPQEAVLLATKQAELIVDSFGKPEERIKLK